MCQVTDSHVYNFGLWKTSAFGLWLHRHQRFLHLLWQLVECFLIEIDLSAVVAVEDVHIHGQVLDIHYLCPAQVAGDHDMLQVGNCIAHTVGDVIPGRNCLRPAAVILDADLLAQGVEICWPDFSLLM